jgi:undecaprenyl-diphosphatase
LTVLHAIVLGLVQGLSEFLPISSSAHLILVPWFLGWPESGINFDVALHLGTLAAVTLYFWKDLLGLAVEGVTKGTKTPTGRLAWGIVIGTIPGALAGVLFEQKIGELFRTNYVLIAILLAAVGAALYLVDRMAAKRRTLEQATLLDIGLIGLGQALALIPGVSRSGATITTALLLGYKREAAAKVSFLLGFPIILGAGLKAVKDMSSSDINPLFFLGVVVSAITGYLVIGFLMDYLKKGSFAVFAIYRGALAALVIIVALVRG